MKTTTVLAAILVLSGALAQAEDFRGTAGVEYFSWREYIPSCPRVLEERGPRFFAGLEGSVGDHPARDVRLQGIFYAARVLYDGFDQFCQPLMAGTGYLGLTGELDATHWPGAAPSHSRMARFGLNLGLGADIWRRTIIAAGGYSEDYVLAYTRLGLAAKRGDRWTAAAGVKYPFLTHEVAHLRETGFSSDASLTPRGDYSLYANIRYQVPGRNTFLIYYDSYRFNASDPVSIGACPTLPCSVHQPTSHQDTVGLSVIIDY